MQQPQGPAAGIRHRGRAFFSSAAACMDPEMIILSGISQKEEDK